MKTVQILLVTLVFLLATVVQLQARIIHVPDDYETIQDAIDESEDGDTVLVQPGEYREVINFNGRAITVASLFLTTGEEAYLDSTIINAEEHIACVSVVRFDHEEDENSILTGFTLTNGTGSRDLTGDNSGGGICCLEANPRLDHLKIIDNIAGYGGGIIIQSCSPHLSNSFILNNRGSSSGGGMHISRDANPLITHTVIANNLGNRYGGAISTYSSCHPRFINVTIVGNITQDCYGPLISVLLRSYVELINTIIWDNDPSEITLGYYSVHDTLSINYSDFEGGEENIDVDENSESFLIWHDENIDEDPLFVDLDNGDFHLQEDSPCIDAGDPDIIDLDGTRSDIGAFPFFRFPVLQGYVHEFENEDPIADAIVSTSHGFNTQTDDDGFWQFDPIHAGDFNLTASKQYYTDSTLFDLHLDPAETLEVIIGLRHPEFVPSVEEIHATLDTGDSTEINFSVQNNGNAPVTWSVDYLLAGEVITESWGRRRTIPAGEILEDSRLKGVIYVDGYFFVSGDNFFEDDDGENLIYVLDRDGELVRSFEQFGQDYGMNDLAWDGELIWGSGERRVYGFTTDGEVQQSWDGPFNTNRAITWDTAREIFWITGLVSNYISGIDRDGNEVDSLGQYGLQISGLAYWSEDPDGYPLYIIHSPGGSGQVIHKINPDEGDTMLVAELEPEEGGFPGGSFIADKYDPYAVVFMILTSDRDGDRIDIWQVLRLPGWLGIEPSQGVIESNNSENFTLTLNSLQFDIGLYEGEIQFEHNASGGETILPVTLTIELSAIDSYEENVPIEFGIIEVYPNPFNSVTTVRYDIARSAHLNLSVYDINGRLVESLFDGSTTLGSHCLTWDASRLSSGLYLIRTEVGERHSYTKVALVK